MIRTKASRRSRMYAIFGARQRAERAVAKEATQFFKTQAKRMASRFEALGGVLLASELLTPESESEALIEKLTSPLLRAMTIGAQFSLTDSQQIRLAASAAISDGRKLSSATLASIQYEIDALELELEIPRELMLQIQTAIRENLDAPFWVDIQGVVLSDLQGIIDTGISDGWSIVRTARAIQDSMSNLSRTRAVRIARTEVLGAMNGGQVAGIAQIEAESGLAMTKEWISVHGSTTRETHSEADGQEVPVNGQFTVGGYPCRFPGDWTLPASERVNCQCGILSGILDN